MLAINLQDLQQDAKKKRRQTRLWSIIVVLLVMFALAGPLVTTSLYQRNSNNLVYNITQSSDWKAYPSQCNINALSVNYNDLWLSDCNKIMVFSTDSKTSIYRYSDIGYTGTFVQFVSLSKVTWAIGDDGTVALFDGDWQLFMKAIPGSIVNVAASNTRLVVITDDNNIHVVGRDGQITTIQPPPNTQPPYSLSGDGYGGNIYLASDGIWLLNGDAHTWTKVTYTPALAQGEFINPADSASIIYKTSSAIYLLALNETQTANQIIGTVTEKDLGITLESIVKSDFTYFATDENLYQQTDQGFEELSNDRYFTTIDQISFHPRGGVYILQLGHPWLFTNIDPFLGVLIVIGLGAAPLFGMVFFGLHRVFRHIDHSRKLLRSLVPELPVYQSTLTPQRIGLMGLVIGAWMAFVTITHASVSVTIVGILIYIILFSYLIMFSNPSRDAATKAYLGRQMLWLGINLALLSVVLTVLFRFVVPYTSSSPLLGYLIIIVGYIAFVLLNLVLVLVPLYSIQNGPIARGDYEQALRQTQLWQRRSPGNPNCLLLTQTIYAYKGDWDNAKEYAYRYASEIQNVAPINAMIALGGNFLIVEPDEAEALILGALESAPEKRPIYYLAAIWLLNHDHVDQAQKMLNIATTRTRKPWSMSPMLWEGHVSLRAQILAKTGNTEGAETLVNDTLRSIRPEYRHRRAALLYTLGLIKHDADQKDSARDYFQKTIDLIPGSSYSKHAQEMLTAL